LTSGQKVFHALRSLCYPAAMIPTRKDLALVAHRADRTVGGPLSNRGLSAAVHGNRFVFNGGTHSTRKVRIARGAPSAARRATLWLKRARNYKVCRTIELSLEVNLVVAIAHLKAANDAALHTQIVQRS